MHEFRYRVAWLYLNLDELAEVMRRLWFLSKSKWSMASFRVADHLNPDELAAFNGDLPAFVRSHAQAAGAQVTEGPICLLTPLRHFGFYFSPISIFYCWDQDQSNAPTVVTEVSNTPWRQKHWYVLGDHNATAAAANSSPGPRRFSHAKNFHVSPFMDMDQRYDWTVSNPAEKLSLAIQSYDQEGMIFTAALNLKRRPLDNWSFSGTLLRYPCVPLQILSAIYFEAFRLWRKELQYYPNPTTNPAEQPSILTQKTPPAPTNVQKSPAAAEKESI